MKGANTVVNRQAQLPLTMSELKKQRARSPFPYLLVLPYVAMLIVFTFYPFVRCIWLTFFATDSIGRAGTFIGLKMWKKILTGDEFWRSVHNTLRYGGCIGVGTFSLAMILSYMSTKQVKGSKVYQTLFGLPMALATTPIAAICTYIFGRYGLVNAIFGTTTTWLSDSNTMFPVIVGIVIWCNCGSSYLYLLVGFRNVSDELIECADLDGASPVRKFFQLFIPIASPQIFFVIFLNILSAFKSFTMIKVLIGTEDSELCVLIAKLYNYAFARERYEMGCIYALVLSIVIFLVSRIQFIVEHKVVYYA